MNPSNVETVIVAGKVRKWKGQLLDVDLRSLREQLEASRNYLFSTARFGRTGIFSASYFRCGSLMATPIRSSSTFTTRLPTLRISRRYSSCTTSRDAGSIEIGPRGLSGFL